MPALQNSKQCTTNGRLGWSLGRQESEFEACKMYQTLKSFKSFLAMVIEGYSGWSSWDHSARMRKEIPFVLSTSFFIPLLSFTLRKIVLIIC